MSSRGKTVTTLLILTCLIAAAAKAESLHATGTWVSSDTLESGTWKASFDAAGADLAGQLEFKGSSHLSGGQVTGTLGQGTVQFGMVFDETERLVFTGTVDGFDLSGDFSSPELSGSWRGSFRRDEPTPSVP